MVRKNGWQLPAHTFQIIAITVYFLLVVAFYAFFAPFLGKQVLEYVAFGIYSPVVFVVFILYIRCTTINPADPGIMSKFDEGFRNAAGSSTGLQGANLPERADTTTGTNSPTSTFRSSVDGRHNNEHLSIQSINRMVKRPYFAHYVMLRSCDKCVDGFDHHCRLAIEIGVGIAVLVVCFVNKNSESIIQDKLGNGLTRAPFATIVAIFTVLSLVACIPLGELFFFHMILIRKGITTYEYVVAMRAMSETPQEEEEEDGVNIVYSPTNSATTGFSGGSSLGLPYKGSWCTPPRIFIDQDEVIPHLDPGMVPSTIDPDNTGNPERANKSNKKQVKISAWKLAKLDTNDAMKAAARARASSSVLRPVADARRAAAGDMMSSSGNGSLRSSSMSAAGGDDGGSSVMSSPVRIHKINFTPRPPPPPPTLPAAQNAGIPRPPPVPATARVANPMFQSATSYFRENRRASVVWDQEAGRYVSVAPAPATARSADQPAVKAPPFLASSGGEAVNARSRNINPAATNAAAAAASSSSAALPSGEPSERLTYSGQSIFFGGPLLGEPRRDEATARDRAAESFPVFAPGTFQKNPPFRR
uniref:Protein S-acyltransferase n=1 Tax=Leersia perrieri TaxID=77586 RepID=A0A0D9XAS7_9ORYZ